MDVFEAPNAAAKFCTSGRPVTDASPLLSPNKRKKVSVRLDASVPPPESDVTSAALSVMSYTPSAVEFPVTLRR